MPEILDIFNNGRYNAVSLTGSILKVPKVPTFIRNSGLFREVGVRTRQVAFQIENRTVNLLPTRPWGAEPTYGTMGQEGIVYFNIPHIPHNDYVTATDVQSVLANVALIGGNAFKTVDGLVNDKLVVMRAKHDVTLEYMLWGALTGQVLNAQGAVLLDIYAQLGITKPSINFDLTNASSPLEENIRLLKRTIENNAQGAVFSGIEVFVGTTFFDRMMKNNDVIAAKDANRGTITRGVDYRNRFEFDGVVFTEVSGTLADINGVTHEFIPAAEGLAYPVGTTGLFETAFAPADTIEYVNTPGQPVYAMQERMRFGKAIEIHTQSNPLPYCKRPEMLIRLY
jgi:hypothetical protein